MEYISLTTPEEITEYRLDQLILKWFDSVIIIKLIANTGQHKSIKYDGVQAKNLMTVLNTANLSTKSLHKRVLEYILNNDGIVGTIVTE